MAIEEERRGEPTPQDLNKTLRKLLAVISPVQIGMLGTVIGSDVTAESDMTPEEEEEYFNHLRELQTGSFGIIKPEPRTLEEIERELSDDWKEMYIDQAKGKVLQDKRARSEHTAVILEKLGFLMPFVQGTEGFKHFVRYDMQRAIQFGVSNGGQDHWLYGDESGGIFNPDSIEQIEEGAFRGYNSDIEWYGVSPIIGRVFEVETDPVYIEHLGAIREWRGQFIERYGRIPTNIRGSEINIP